MNKNSIKEIVFDIGGVLQLGEYSKKASDKNKPLGVHEYVAKKLKISLDQYFDSIDSTYAKSMEGKLSEKQVLAILSKNLQISIPKLKKLFTTAYKKNFKFNKQLFKQALKIKEKGYKISIFSDQWHLSKPILINKQITKNFDPILISCYSGMRKPNPQFYKFLLKKLKLPAKQVLFIDNQQWNIKPAKKLGINTILFKNNKQLFEQLFKLGIK